MTNETIENNSVSSITVEETTVPIHQITEPPVTTPLGKYIINYDNMNSK